MFQREKSKVALEDLRSGHHSPSYIEPLPATPSPLGPHPKTAPKGTWKKAIVDIQNPVNDGNQLESLVTLIPQVPDTGASLVHLAKAPSVTVHPGSEACVSVLASKAPRPPPDLSRPQDATAKGSADYAVSLRLPRLEDTLELALNNSRESSGGGKGNRTIMVPRYLSRGPYDILNRSNILKLLKGTPSLRLITSSDITSISFVDPPTGVKNEATLITWSSAAIASAVWKEQKLLLAWGIELCDPVEQGYPMHLIPDKSFNSITTKYNHEARGDIRLNDQQSVPLTRHQRAPAASVLRSARSVTLNTGKNNSSAGAGMLQVDTPPENWSWIAGVLSKTINQ